MFRFVSTRKILNVPILVALIMITSTGLAKAEYPTKPINLMVGFSAGGGVDTYARALSGFMHEHLVMPMVVVNKPGSSGSIAAKYTVDRPADGNVLYITNVGTLVTKNLIDGKKSPYDPLKDFQSLGTIGQLVTGLVVPVDSPFKSATDLVAAAKANPGTLRWSHPGRGSLHTMAGMAFLKANGVTAQDVPFKGGAKARNAVAGQQVDFAFVGIQLMAGFQTKLRALGVSSAERDKANPDVPSFGEQGLQTNDITGPIMVLGRTDLPKEVTDKVIPAIKAVAESKGYAKLMKKAGTSAFYKSPADGQAQMQTLHDTLKPIVSDVVAK